MLLQFRDLGVTSWPFVVLRRSSWPFVDHSFTFVRSQDARVSVSPKAASQAFSSSEPPSELLCGESNTAATGRRNRFENNTPCQTSPPPP